MEQAEVLGDTVGGIAVSLLYGHVLSGQGHSTVLYGNTDTGTQKKGRIILTSYGC